jgi:hypothetical protein
VNLDQMGFDGGPDWLGTPARSDGAVRPNPLTARSLNIPSAFSGSIWCGSRGSYARRTIFRSSGTSRLQILDNPGAESRQMTPSISLWTQGGKPWTPPS